MPTSFTSKAATFVLSLLFLLIIVSFLFGDYKNMGSASPQDVASVNGLAISPREFNMRLSQQLEFFNQMMGGQLTPQQIQQMGIKETVLSQLIQTKLILSFGLKNGLALSEDEVKAEIKKLPYFQRDGKFDVGLYRNLLNANQYSPAQFEDLISNDVATRKMEMMLAQQNVAEGFARDVLRFKLTGVRTESLRVERPQLVKLIKISDAEASEFAGKPENAKLLEDMYQENAATYNKPEEVKARHILFRADTPEAEKAAEEKAKKLLPTLTAKNFAEKASALSEDPSGKGKGGDLGWFGRGRMVPEFDKAAFDAKPGSLVGPIKTQFGYHILLVENKKAADVKPLEAVKTELARMALQKRKSMDLDQLMTSTKAELQALLAKGDAKAIASEKERMGLTHLPGTEVNLYDQTVGPHTLTAEESKKLFGAVPGEIIDLSTPGALFLVKVQGKVEGDVEAKLSTQLKTETTAQSQVFSRKLREDLVKELNAQSKVVTNPSLL